MLMVYGSLLTTGLTCLLGYQSAAQLYWELERGASVTYTIICSYLGKHMNGKTPFHLETIKEVFAGLDESHSWSSGSAQQLCI